MRDTSHLNHCQQLLVSALALVDEEDLVAIFRAARNHPSRNRCIDLMNSELDKGVGLMEALAAPSRLYALFTKDWPELRVLCRKNRYVHLDFGSHGPPGDIGVWIAHMAGTGIVEKLEFLGRYHREGRPVDSELNGPTGPEPITKGPGLQ